MLNKKEVEGFLTNKKGYLKKSAIEVIKAIFKNNINKSVNTPEELLKDLELIKKVQKELRNKKDITFNSELLALITELQVKPRKRLFFDIETSPNVVFSWRIGNKINLSHDNIIEERAIICISYKWEGEEEVYSLKWNEGCDKDMLEVFSTIIDSADEVIGQNSDKFDIKWLRARCIFHGIPISVKFNSIDTLKMARAGFNFNSNKLDYMGQYLGEGAKLHTGYDLWKKICLFNDENALNEMIVYCEQDVRLLEKVYNKLQAYVPVKKFKYKF